MTDVDYQDCLKTLKLYSLRGCCEHRIILYNVENIWVVFITRVYGVLVSICK
uniref:Uncharacterized protein n=1 Tax=Octopus bimaculoides TaxID=37653 RepID=A0A0L8H9Y9_OCTBM